MQRYQRVWLVSLKTGWMFTRKSVKINNKTRKNRHQTMTRISMWLGMWTSNFRCLMKTTAVPKAMSRLISVCRMVCKVQMKLTRPTVNITPFSSNRFSIKVSWWRLNCQTTKIKVLLRSWVSTWYVNCNLTQLKSQSKQVHSIKSTISRRLTAGLNIKKQHSSNYLLKPQDSRGSGIYGKWDRHLMHS